ncbi:DUF3006 domain-containing protein [Halomarina litorea]|uniref:DUF3006 domain-containing protein n=1 Tax=Halomarina litorea TaxID=2961595 RepID=UPI0020C43395|nr:DUF3006 domain-containing protein [Halomarina sp. BCD28]
MPRYTAVLDRFEGDDAVLVLERGGEDVDDIAVPRSDLPERGRKQDAVFAVVVRDGELRSVRYKPHATRSRGERAQSRFDRLARRPPRRGDDGDAGES